MAVDRDARYDAVEVLCGGGGSKHVRGITGSGGFALERQLQWLETAASGDATDMFRTAAAVQWLHGIIPDVSANGHGIGTPGLLELLDGSSTKSRRHCPPATLL